LIKLALENNKFSSLLRLGVYHALLKLFECVYDLEKVTVIEEKVEVFLLSFLYNGFNRE